MKPRIILAGFESKTNKPLLDYFNISDRDPYHLAKELEKEFKIAKIAYCRDLGDSFQNNFIY